MTKKKHLGAAVLLTVCLSLCLCPTAFADTDGTEPKITQQPDQLVLQLGTRWAGVEFELRTDAGLYPATIVVDESGVLTMDLGGSKTYTLSCINSAVPIPDPEVSGEQPANPGQAQSPAEDIPQTNTPSQSQNTAAQGNRVPTGAVVLFLIGFVCAVGGLIALFLSKRRQSAAYDEWDEDEEDE